MNEMIVQFAVTAVVCVGILAYLKPWRMRATASPVVYTLVGMAYLLSYFLMVSALPVFRTIPSQWWVPAAWSGVFGPAILICIWAAADLKTGRPNAHTKIEPILHAAGATIGIAFVIFLILSTTVGKAVRIGRNDVDTLALSLAAPFGAGLAYALFASAVLLIAPGNDLERAVERTLPLFRKIFFFVLTPAVFLAFALYLLSLHD